MNNYKKLELLLIDADIIVSSPLANNLITHMCQHKEEWAKALETLPALPKGARQ